MTALSSTLPAARSSARRARDLVATTLVEAGYDDQSLIDRLLLVTSELVTNAIVHAGTDIQVRVRTEGRDICLEVIDGARSRPRRRRPSLTDTGGRGLVLVDALVDAWGVVERPGGAGKKVWIRIKSGPPGRSTAPDRSESQASAQRTVAAR